MSWAATAASPMTSAASSGAATPQHQQQVLGRPPTAASPLACSRRIVGASPASAGSTSHSPATSVQWRCTEPVSSCSAGDVGHEDVEVLVDAVGGQLRLDLVHRRRPPPRRRARWTAVSWATRRATHATSRSPAQVHTGVDGSTSPAGRPAVGGWRAAIANSSSSPAGRSRRSRIRSCACSRTTSPRSGAPRRRATRGRRASSPGRRHPALAVGGAERPRAARAVAPSASTNDVTSTGRRRYDASAARSRRQIGDRRQLVEVLVVVDVLVLPQQRVGDVDGVGAERQDGQDVAAHGVADHAEPLGRDVDGRQDAGIRVGVLLQHDLDVVEVVGQPRGRDLAHLVHEVTLRDQHEAVVATHVGQHLRHVRAAGARSRSACPSRRPAAPRRPTPAPVPSETVMAAWIIERVNALTP